MPCFELLPLAAQAGAVSDLLSWEALIALLTLAAIEVVLGIDNIVFIAILADRLPAAKRPLARRLGLGAALVTRVLLLLGITWVMGLTAALFTIPLEEPHPVSGRDLILLGGGLFLIAKATWEIHDKLEGEEPHHAAGRASATLGAVVVQIGLLDVVFSLDSVITAVGMVRVDPDARWVAITIMVSAIVIAIAVMLVFAGPVSDFVGRHPTIKMLALSFLILIGVLLVAEGLHLHVPKGYVYFAMAFSLGVELLNMRARRPRAPVQLHQSYVEERVGVSADRPRK